MINLTKVMEYLDNTNISHEELINNLSEKKTIYLKNDMDIYFFNLLVLLYKPFLSVAYRKAHIQSTIFSKQYKYPVGIIALIKTKAGGQFLEISLIPEVRGKGYASQAIKLFIKDHHFKAIGWTIHKANFPSARLLQKLGGGFFERTIENKKRIQAEGFFRPDIEVSEPMQKALEKLLPESKKKYKQWIKEYKLRTNELKNLKKYLKEY